MSLFKRKNKDKIVEELAASEEEAAAKDAVKAAEERAAAVDAELVRRRHAS